MSRKLGSHFPCPFFMQLWIICIKSLGSQWIGLKFHFPILWEVIEPGQGQEFWKKVHEK